MASYHLHVKIISRGDGKSVVASAAYRSRSKIKFEREGETFDYSNYDGSDHNHDASIKKSGDTSVVAAAAYRSRSDIDGNDFSGKTDLAFSEIMLPKIAPKWMLDRSRLWNHVEEISKRKDARLAREVEIALPKELSLEQNIALIKEYVSENFVSNGMVADVNIHNLENNPHAHILLSTRYVTENGFGATNRRWNRTKNISLWREKWSSVANYHLAKADFDVRIDHRSFKDRGIDLIPQIKIRKDNNTAKIDRTNKLQEILIQNGNRIINDPTIALKFLTENSAVFSHEDMLKFVNGHSHYTQFKAVVTAIEKCKEMIKVKEADDEQSDRYSSAQLVGLEKKLELDTVQLSYSSNHKINDKFISRAIKECKLSPEQSQAVNRAVKGDDLALIIGYAGSGKSYTMRGIKQAYESAGYSVSGVALSGIAADSLEKSSGINSSTIHRKILQWEKGLEKLTSKSVLIIDEAGTVGTRHMQRILEEVKAAGCKVIMIGDPNQTQAVEAGSTFRMALEKSNSVSLLQEIWRQNKTWQREASKLFAGDRNDIFAALDLYAKHGRVKACDDYPQTIRHIVNGYVDHYSSRKTQLILTHTNKDVDFLNIACREKLKLETKELAQTDFAIKTKKGKKYFCVNDRIIFLNNDRRLNVKNGSFGTIKSIDSLGNLVVELDNKNAIAFDVRRYNAIDHGYAATVHKTQGATIDNSYFLAGQGNDRHLSYVAMTRHRQDAHIYYSKDEFQNFEHVKRTLSNSALKQNVADYKSKEGSFNKILARLTSNNVLFKLKDGEEHNPDIRDHIVPVIKNRDGSVSYTTDAAIEAEKKMYQSAGNLSTKSTHAFGAADIDQLSCHLFACRLHVESFEDVLCGNDLVVLNHGIIDSAEKTYFLKSLKDVYQDLGYVVEGISLSSLGADSLKKQSGIDASTVSKTLSDWASGRNQLTQKSLLIVDNANMIGTASMQKILHQAENNNAKLILVGNKHLLQPIEAGSPLRGIIDKYQRSVVELKSDRSSAEYQPNDLSALLSGDRKSVSTALDRCVQNGTVYCLGDNHKAKDMLVLDWLKNQDKSIIVAQKKATAEALNKMAHDRLKESGKIGTEEHKVNGIGVCTGERIMFLKNDHGLGVKNGTVGTVKQVLGSTLHVDIGPDHGVVVNTEAYQDLTYGYATNIHRLANNISYEKLFVHATPDMDRNSVVTIFQAAKDIAWYHCFDSNFEFRSRLSRDGYKRMLSDFRQNPLSKKDQEQSLRQLKLKHGIRAEFWSNETYGGTVKGTYKGIIKLNDHEFARFEDGKTTLAPYKADLESYRDRLIRYNPNTGKITKLKEHYYELYLKDKDSGRSYRTKTICKVFDSSEIETAQRDAAAEFCKKIGIRNVEANFKRLTYFEGRKIFDSKLEQEKRRKGPKNYAQKAKQRKSS